MILTQKTLLDEFAIAILPGFLANDKLVQAAAKTKNGNENFFNDIASVVYSIAELMMQERQKYENS